MFGNPPKDQQLTNLALQNTLSGCENTSIKTRNLTACQAIISGATIDSECATFPQGVCTPSISGLTLPIFNPPRVFGSATDADPIISPFLPPGLDVDPSQFSSYEEFNITFIGNGQWTFNEPGLYEIIMEYELQNGVIPANTAQNLAVLSGGVRINLVLLTHIVELIKVTTGPAITTAETNVYGRQYLRALAGDTVRVRLHATGVQGIQSIRHRSFSIRWVAE